MVSMSDAIAPGRGDDALIGKEMRERSGHQKHTRDFVDSTYQTGGRRSRPAAVP